jgi:glycylpeptide N-tetradecanoyltransferase
MKHYRKVPNKKIKIPKYPVSQEEAMKWTYNFWNTQPIPKLNEPMLDRGGIIATVDETLIKLPELYHFDTLDIRNDDKVQELCDFLNDNYYEEDSGKFRTFFEKNTVRWYLLNSYYDPNMCLCVRKDNDIIGLMCGVVNNMQIGKRSCQNVEINFVCIKKVFRAKRLLPVLATEFNLRMNKLGYKHGFFATNKYVPKPFSKLNAYHRAINMKKLIDVGFVNMQGKIDMDHVNKALEMDNKFSTKNFKKMDEDHLEDVYELFNKYMEKYYVHPIYTFEEFTNVFYNNDVVVSYVLTDDSDIPIDFISYYNMKLKVTRENDNIYLNKAVLFYYTSITETPYRLIKDILLVAKNNGNDLVTMYDVMENINISIDLFFDKSSSLVNMNMYNWLSKEYQNIQIAKIPFI